MIFHIWNVIYQIWSVIYHIVNSKIELTSRNARHAAECRRRIELGHEDEDEDEE